MPSTIAGRYAATMTARPNSTAGPAARTLGKDQREVEKERRQHEDRDRIGPVEDPVETIETAAEREREHAEEGRRDPEEMQRRRIARTPQPHGAADQQRERADRRQHEIEHAGPAGNRRQVHVDRLARRAQSKRRCSGASSRASAPCSAATTSSTCLDGGVVDRQQDIAALQPHPSRLACLARSRRRRRRSFCSVQSTPSSTSCHVARAAMFAAPRQSSTVSASSGRRARIHRSVDEVSNKGLNRSSNQMERKNAPKIAGRWRNIAAICQLR